MELEILYQILLLLPLLGFIGSGSGTDADPFIVTNMDELNDVRNDLTAVYEQANDIDAGAETDNSGGDYWNGGSGWDPIGTFTGEYRGAGFKIDGLFIDRSATDEIALFSFEDGAIISELGLTNVNITGNDHVATFVGDSVASSTGTIDRCYATGSATSTSTGNAFLGGLCGEYDGTINDCYTDVSLTQTNTQGYVGGLIGQNVATVNRCYAVGAISAEDGIRTGGLIGRDFGTVNDSFWDTQTTGESSSDGGTGKTTAEMQDVATFTDTTTTGLTNPWDFVGNPNDDAANNDYWDIDSGYPFLTAFDSVTTTTLEFAQGSYTLTGQDVGFVQTDILPFNQGSYSVTGQNIGLVEVTVLAFEQGSYTITGSTAELVETDVLEFGQGSYTITGQDIGLVSVDVLDFQQGSYAITGQDIGLITSTTTTMTFGQGSYSITGQDIGLKQVDVLSFGQGNYAISGQDIGLKKVDILSFDQGTYNISGQLIGFVEIQVLDFEQGTYSITGKDFRIVISSPEVLTLDSTIATFIELDSEIMTQLNLDSKI